jgi:hypothetical protein
MAQDLGFKLPPGLIAVVGFAVGLLATFMIGGLFGIPPSTLWPLLVILLLLWIFCLEHPKLYLGLVGVYYLTAANGNLFGKVHLPIPMASQIDELVLAVPFAILTMKAIERRLPGRATIFPLVFVVLAALSFKVNGVPKTLAFKATLTHLKFFIYWYFARSIGPWNNRERRAWAYAVIAMACLQFCMNLVWQRGPIPIHGDLGTGTLGGAHLVGYFSAFGLFFAAALFFFHEKPLKIRHVFLLILFVVIMIYNIIFLTDTKHMALFLPLAALPFFLSPRVRLSARLALAAAGLLFAWLGYLYVREYEVRLSLQDLVFSYKYSGRAYLFNAVLHWMGREVPFPLLGAGPGNFCSWHAVFAFRPLAEKHVIPFVIDAIRSGGRVTEASVVGTPVTSLHTLLGEYGPISALFYYGFWFYGMRWLWKGHLAREQSGFARGAQLAVVASMLLTVLLSYLLEIFELAIITMPIWTMAAVFWEPMPPASAGKKDSAPPASPPGLLPPAFPRPAWRGPP